MLSWNVELCRCARGVLGFGEARARVAAERGRLRGRDPARWKEGAILRFPIGRARPRPPQKIENSPTAAAEFSIFCGGYLPSGILREGQQQLPQGDEGRFWILLDEALTRTSLLPATTPQLLLNWSVGHLPPLALGSGALRTSNSVKNLCDYWSQQLPQGAEGRFKRL